MLLNILRTDNSPAQLFVRVALGAVMFPHGAQKVLGWFGGPGFFKTLETFGQIGFPAWLVVLLMAVEFIGSLLLIAGLLTRLWALAMGGRMTICMGMHHVEHGFFMNWVGRQQGEGISGQDVIVRRKLEQRADGIIGVEGQTMAVRDQDKEKVHSNSF